MSARLIFPSLLFLAFSFPCASQDLQGPCTREEILRNSPEWLPGVAAYNPKPEIVERLRAVSREVRVDIYFGTWCSDSKAHVCEYFKVLDMADTPLIQTACYAIPEDKNKRAPFFRGNDIQKIPTFIVYMDGQEKGRIVEIPKKSIEEDLLEIIEK